jgi:hypothetical protein
MLSSLMFKVSAVDQGLEHEPEEGFFDTRVHLCFDHSPSLRRCPPWFARTFLGVDELSVNLAHILRAVMCLYLALGLFWLYSAFSDRLRDTAILTTMVFAGGLLAGRVLSFILDGQPAPLLIFYTVVEFVIIPVAWWVYARPDNSSSR